MHSLLKVTTLSPAAEMFCLTADFIEDGMFLVGDNPNSSSVEFTLALFHRQHVNKVYKGESFGPIVWDTLKENNETSRF